jgi:hypothetical protein
MVLETRSPKPRCQQGWCLMRALPPGLQIATCSLNASVALPPCMCTETELSGVSSYKVTNPFRYIPYPQNLAWPVGVTQQIHAEWIHLLAPLCLILIWSLYKHFPLVINSCLPGLPLGLEHKFPRKKSAVLPNWIHCSSYRIYHRVYAQKILANYRIFKVFKPRLEIIWAKKLNLSLKYCFSW